ncbi:hypothetical protein FACS1894155_01340 [Bacteroidia bacterium]|nr:hypothetical protein FACS1894155_01340 [Bacteroidia bacterium]
MDSLIVEFILVDFGSTDGLKEWIGENFKQELKSGYLKYYYTEKLSSWHASIAKNTAHFYADNDILVNLDCDNYTGYRGGKFVIQQFIQSKDFKIVLHQFNQYGDGSFGRIGVLRRFFDAIYRNMETDRMTKETFVKDGIPALSIVIPVYNVPTGYLQEAMDSILDQTFVDFELIIVDDGSTDDSISIIKSYNDNRIRLIQNNHDFIGSLNIGMTAARGKYIVRMDADDIMLPHRLQVQYEFMEKHPKIAVCGSWIEKFGNDERIVQLPGEHEQIVTSMLSSNPMAHPSVMIRKNVFEQLGMELYKREYPCAEDYKLWTDLALKGCHFANIPEVLLKYRCSEHQVTHTKWNTMLQSTQKIQAEYAEEIMEQIVSQEQRYMDLFNSLIDLSNEGLLHLNGLLNIVYRIYVFFLRNSVPLHSGF